MRRRSRARAARPVAAGDERRRTSVHGARAARGALYGTRRRSYPPPSRRRPIDEERREAAPPLIGVWGGAPDARRRRRRLRLGSPLRGRTGTAGSRPATSTQRWTPSTKTQQPAAARTPRRAPRRRSRRPPPAIGRTIGGCRPARRLPYEGLRRRTCKRRDGRVAPNAVSGAAAGGDCPAHLLTQPRPADRYPGDEAIAGLGPAVGGRGTDSMSGADGRRGAPGGRDASSSCRARDESSAEGRGRRGACAAGDGPRVAAAASASAPPPGAERMGTTMGGRAGMTRSARRARSPLIPLRNRKVDRLGARLTKSELSVFPDAEPRPLLPRGRGLIGNKDVAFHSIDEP